MVELTEEKKEAMKYYRIGLKLYNRGYYKQAIEPLKKAIKFDNKLAIAFNLLGLVYKDLESYPESINYYLEALKISPKSFNVLFHLGSTYFELNLLKNALECFKKVKDLYHDHPEVDYAIAETYFDMGNKELAKKYYLKAGKWQKKIIKANNEEDDIFNLAHIYDRLGELLNSNNLYKKAILTFDKFLEEKPDDSNAHYRIGLLYCNINDKKSALKHYEILKKNEEDLAEDLYEVINYCS